MREMIFMKPTVKLFLGVFLLFSTILPGIGLVLFTIVNVGDMVQAYPELVSEFETIKLWLLIILGVILVLDMFFATVVTNMVFGPVYKLTEAAKKIAKGHNDINLSDFNAKSIEFITLRAAFQNVLDSNEKKINIIQDIANGNLRNINIPDDTEDVLLQNIDVVLKNLIDFTDRIEDTSNEIILGSLSEKVDSKGLHGDYKELVDAVNRMNGSVIKKLDQLPLPILTINKNYKVLYANKAAEAIHGVSNSIGMNCYDVTKYKDCASGNGSCKCGLAMQTNSFQNGKTKTELSNGEIYYADYSGTPLLDSNNKVVGVIEVGQNVSEQVIEKNKYIKQSDFQKESANQLLENINKLANGEFNLDFKELAYDTDTKEVYELFDSIDKGLIKAVSSIGEYVNEISDVLDQLSSSNLDVSVTREYSGDFSSIKTSLNRIIDSFNEIITSIYQTSYNVSNGAGEMTESSVNLKTGATEQASAIEEVSATVTQVAAQVKENASNASLVNDSANGAVMSAEESNQYMHQLTDAMKDIQKSTSQIQKVLKMINDIAFQTNILSLNAAVEAARAGSHGKGFAVIAEDVRNLALKSASAADETSDMLDNIVNQINESVSFTKDTANSLENILVSSKESARKSTEVATASNEQATAVSQITLSLDQISQVVQRTSANANANANVSGQLSDYADELMGIVSNFNLKNKIDYNVKKDISRKAPIQDEVEPTIMLDDFNEF
jgi:methyl-accepting chemotaxis protein